MGSRKIAFGLIMILVVGLAATIAEVTDQQLQTLPIGSIKMEGNVKLTKNDILSKIQTRVGEFADQAVLTEDVKRIGTMEGVTQSYFNLDVVDNKIQVTFVVVEKNLIRSIDFVGNKKYNDKKLISKLGFKVGNFLDPVLSETGKDAVADYYKKKGYTFFDIQVSGQREPEGRLVYTVNEGPRVKITSMKFAGNDHIKSSELNKVVKSKTRKYFIFANYLITEILDEDVAKLQKAYYERGYLDVKVNAKTDFNVKKDKVKITFEITEGPAYTINKITISGNEYFNIEKLQGLLKSQEGAVYNKKLAESDVQRIVKLYKENGFVDSVVKGSSPFVEGERNKVDLDITITEGGQFKIGKIDITGNAETQDRVVRNVLNEYEFKPLSLYNADIAAGDGKGFLEKRVAQSTVAQSATITPLPGKMPNQKNANVNIVEGQTGSIMLGAGVASDSGLIGQVVYEQKNFDISDKPESLEEFFAGKAFKGAGQDLRIALEPGTEVSEYSVSFSDYYFKDKPQTLDVGGSIYERERESYNEQRTKGYVGLEKRLKNDWRTNIGFRLENVNVGDIESTAPQDVVDVEGDNLLAGIKFGFGRDKTDDKFFPTKGYSYNVSYEQVGGDHTFGILTGVYRKYYTLYEDLAEQKTVLATQLRAGDIVGNAPVFEKFYAGGQKSIRGFEYRGVSPRAGVNKDPIGSNWLVSGNAEVIKPLVSENFAALFFVDGAMIETGGVRASVGTGIQILIPQWFGPVPMRFELAMPFMKDSEDETQVFSFSVGRLF